MQNQIMKIITLGSHSYLNFAKYAPYCQWLESVEQNTLVENIRLYYGCDSHTGINVIRATTNVYHKANWQCTRFQHKLN